MGELEPIYCYQHHRCSTTNSAQRDTIRDPPNTSQPKTGVELFTAGKEKRAEKLGLFYIATVFFGLIHGFGFASYYKMINADNDILPLLEFALGVEAAQIIVVIIVLILAFIFQMLFRFNKRDWVLVVSSIVIGMIIPMLIENWIF